MRRATCDQNFIFGNNGQLQGVSLGYDFCAEHEHGVGDLKNLFDVSFQEKTSYQNISDWYKETKDVSVGLISRKVNHIPRDYCFKFIEFYATEQIQPLTKTTILSQYPKAKKALNAKVKHAMLLADTHSFYWLNTKYVDSQGNETTLVAALETYKVSNNHYVLDESVDATKLARAIQNTRTYLELAIRNVWSANAKDSCLADWNDTYFMSTAWNDRSFGIHVKTDVYVNWLKQLFQAFMQKNICFMGQVVGRGWNGAVGLVFGIYDQLYPFCNEAYVKIDKEQLAFAKDQLNSEAIS